MNNTIPFNCIENLSVLLTDFYKQCHAEQYNKNITKLVAYYTPRMSRLERINVIPSTIGLQIFVKEYLIGHFNKYFFNQSLEEIKAAYHYVIYNTMGANRINDEKIIALHNLGYLPIEIRALDEGTLAPIKCPTIEISNTHPDFAWVTNLIESLMSAELWYQNCTAISGMLYRNIVNEYYDITSDNSHLKKSAIAEFGMRGLPGLDAAKKASLGFLLSFNKTATIPSITNIEKYYGDQIQTIATGMASTEHSVMCSSYSLDGNEETQIKKLLTEIYPNGNFSMVCDSYDYWNVVENILPKLKEDILSRDGTVYVRGDSGDPVDIVTKTVFKLWDIFGGTENSKGFKVLDSHIRAIYGDSITPIRARKIYETLMLYGFSAENVALGAGSFSMLCLEEEYTAQILCGGHGMPHTTAEIKTRLQPFTRDTFGVAIKTTYGEHEELVEGLTLYKDEPVKTISAKTTEFSIFKNPKTDSGFKKSQKGCCIVFIQDGEMGWDDGLTFDESRNFVNNLLTPVFRNGELLKHTSFEEIRQRIWNNNF